MFESTAARSLRALWTIAVLMTMGVALSGCEGFGMFGDDKPRTVTTDAPRPTGVVPVLSVLLPIQSPLLKTRSRFSRCSPWRSRHQAGCGSYVQSSGVCHWKISANSAASTMRAVERFLGV